MTDFRALVSEQNINQAEQMSRLLDLPIDTITEAYGPTVFPLQNAFDVARREATKVEGATVVCAVAAPVALGLHTAGHDVIGGLCLAVAIIAAAAYHQGTLGVEACRKDILARYAKAEKPSAPAP